MKRILIGIICGVFATGAFVLPAAALDVVCPENISQAECEKSVQELNEKWEKGELGASKSEETPEKPEIPPTFSVDTNESDRSVKLKFGHGLLLTGNNLSSNLENKSGMTFIAGNNLSLSNKTEYGFIAGNTINFSGETSRDLYIAGNAITLTDEAKLGRDVFVAGNTLNVKTDINGDLAVTAAEVVLDNIKIAGNLNIDAAKIEFVGKVEIAGALTYNDNATVTGLDRASYGSIEAYHVEELDQATIMVARIYASLMSAVCLFLAIALICALYPKLHERIESESSINRFGVDLAIGLGVLIGVPAVALFVLCTIIAAPLAFVLIALYLVAIYLAQAFAGAWLGHVLIEKLFHARGNIFIEAIVGIIILNALSLIPYVGMLTGFLALLLGLGLIVNFLKPAAKKTEKQASAKTTKSKADKTEA